jgi:hypothetical protein
VVITLWIWSRCTPPNAVLTPEALLDSPRGKNIEALRAAFLTLQDHLAAHLTFDSVRALVFRIRRQSVSMMVLFCPFESPQRFHKAAAGDAL